MSGWRVKILKARGSLGGFGDEHSDGTAMSLINQMLQDLDARRAAHGVGTSMHNDVRPLPQPQASRLPIILGSLVFFVLVGGFALYLWVVRSDVVAPASIVSLPVKVVLPGPTIVEPQPVALSLQDLEGSLRIADTISLPIEKRFKAPMASAKPVTEANERAAARSKVAETEPKPVPSSVMPQVSSKSTKPPAIERTDAVGSQRERAESDYRKAISAVNQGRVDEALAGLRNALRQDGFHSASRQLLVKLLLEAKRTDEAIQVLQDGLQVQPAKLNWAMSLARLQVDRGDLNGAWKTLDFSQPAAENNADYQGFLAHVLQRLGRNKEAAEHYQSAARLSPGDGRWWLGLGLALDAEGRSSEAREAFMRARKSGNLSAELNALAEQKLR